MHKTTELQWQLLNEYLDILSRMSVMGFTSPNNYLYNFIQLHAFQMLVALTV